MLVVLLLFIYPFLYGLVLSFEPKEGGGLANYLRFFSEPFLYNTIATTLWLAMPDDPRQCRPRAADRFPHAAQ